MPRASADWQCFDFDQVEKAFCTILNGLGVKAFQKRSIEKRTTPSVEVRLETNGTQGGQFVRFPHARFSQVQPFSNFIFTLNVAAISERTENGTSHAELVARTRAYLQYYWLTLTFTETVSPYHSITEIREIDSPSDIAPEDNLDITQLTFTGIFNIRDTSWPLTIT
jgi:hypothetical protein